VGPLPNLPAAGPPLDHHPIFAGSYLPFSTISQFPYELKAEKYFWGNHFFLKTDFVENIFQQKTFYVETNRALIV
jgi:hypothetical protein